MVHTKMENGDLVHEWDQRDVEEILKELQELAELLGVSMPTFDSYEKTVAGTHKLGHDLYDLLDTDPKYDENNVVRFRLGCFLYHQLMYVEKLTVHYET